jgi:transposase-like protein
MNTMKCKKCGKEFTYEVTSMNVPGGKDKENIDCPYCGETNGTVMTSGFVYTRKIEDDK